MGASVAWCNPSWRTWRTYLGTNKKVFDAEFYPIEKAPEVNQRGRETGRPRTKVHVWVDSKAAIERLQHSEPPPGQ